MFLKKIILLAFIIYNSIPSFLYSQKDTLITIQEFNSPSSLAWGIEYDSNKFFVSADSLGNIYELDTYGELIKTFHFPNRRLKGLTFFENHLWVVNDLAVDDTLIYQPSENDYITYNIYSILKINVLNGMISDSIRFISRSANSPTTNYIWGIGSYNSKLYVSSNSGWGPCTYEIDPITKTVTSDLCCAHPTGFENINESLFCIRDNSSTGIGNDICSLDLADGNLEEKKWYSIDCYASDLTFDGKNIWIYDYSNKKIKKLSLITTNLKIPLNNYIFNLGQNYPNPFNPTTQISYQIPKNSFVNLVVYNTLGQVVSTLVSEHQTSGKYSVQFNANNLPSGVYFYKIESGTFTKVNKMLLLR